MKTTLRTILSTTALLGSTNFAQAATTQDDGSQLVVWAFLGMCALIVILQIVPLIIMSFGMVKALFRGKEVQPAEIPIDE
jgi:hypothetical protein